MRVNLFIPLSFNDWTIKVAIEKKSKRYLCFNIESRHGHKVIEYHACEIFLKISRERLSRMRKIVLSMVMSLDGFVAGEDGDSSWHVMDEEMHDFMDDFLDSVDTLLYGRVAYEMMLQHWPSAEFDKKVRKKIVLLLEK